MTKFVLEVSPDLLGFYFFSYFKSSKPELTTMPLNPDQNRRGANNLIHSTVLLLNLLCLTGGCQGFRKDHCHLVAM